VVGNWAIRRAEPGIEPIRLEAVDDHGAVIGRAWARQDDVPDPSVYRVDITVEEGFRRQGAGSMLMLELLREAAGHSATSVRMRIPGTEWAGLAFAHHRGFSETHRMIHSVLRVTDVDPLRAQITLEQAHSQGIAISTLADGLERDPHCLDRLHDLVGAVVGDIPGEDGAGPLGGEEFRRLYVDDPALIPEAYFLARLGERYVGISCLRHVEQPGVIEQGLSGVRREYRNRGIARTLKRQAIDYALRNGYTWVHATNHSTNTAMLEINYSLGFVPESEEVHLERLLLQANLRT
jgi:GNAT superfamily N-acetyltransferase